MKYFFFSHCAITIRSIFPQVTSHEYLRQRYIIRRNRNCHSYLLPPCSRTKFPQTWPRSKLASFSEPSIIGGTSSLLSFSCTSPSPRHVLHPRRVARDIFLVKNTPNHPNLSIAFSEITNRHIHPLRVCAPESQTSIA